MICSSSAPLRAMARLSLSIFASGAFFQERRFWTPDAAQVVIALS
jgi:hypothetical protein